MTAAARRRQPPKDRAQRLDTCPPHPLASEPAVIRFLDDAKREHTVMADTDAETAEKCRTAIRYWEHPGNGEDAELAAGNAAHWTMKLGAVTARMKGKAS